MDSEACICFFKYEEKEFQLRMWLNLQLDHIKVSPVSRPEMRAISRLKKKTKTVNASMASFPDTFYSPLPVDFSLNFLVKP